MKTDRNWALVRLVCDFVEGIVASLVTITEAHETGSRKKYFLRIQDVRGAGK